jgi:hypothetical protein
VPLSQPSPAVATAFDANDDDDDDDAASQSNNEPVESNRPLPLPTLPPPPVNPTSDAANTRRLVNGILAIQTRFP